MGARAAGWALGLRPPPLVWFDPLVWLGARGSLAPSAAAGRGLLVLVLVFIVLVLFVLVLFDGARRPLFGCWLVRGACVA